MRNVITTMGLLLLTTACTARLGLGSLTGSKSKPAAKADSGGKAGPAIGGGNDEARTRELSKKLTYEHVSDGQEAGEIFSAAGIPTGYNPVRHMKNPDPEWIVYWDALELTDETKTAIAQAAVNRTWTAKVHADYARYRKAWRAIEDDARPKLQTIMEGKGYYARAAALAELLADVRKRAEAAKALHDRSPEIAPVGLLDDIVRAIVQLHRDERVAFLLDDFAAAHQLDLAAFAKHGRPFAADDAVERDLFTQAARAKGTLETPALPVMFEYGKGLKAVRWPVSSERRDEIDAARTAMVTDAAKAKSVELPRRMSALFTGDGPDEVDPKLRWLDPPLGGTDHFTPLTVVKAGAAEVELATTYEYSTAYGCKDTNQWDDNGIRIRDCKYKQHKRKHRLTVKIPELPPGLTLEKGDVVELYADLEDRRERGDDVSYKLTARAIVSVKRDGKEIVKVW
jgi:hypothetical protein